MYVSELFWPDELERMNDNSEPVSAGTVLDSPSCLAIGDGVGVL